MATAIHEYFDDLGHDRFIVVPSHATGSTSEGTRRYMWKAIFAPIFRYGAVNGYFTDLAEADRLARELTERNASF